MNDTQYRIYSHLIGEIVGGKLKPGDKLDSEYDLSGHFCTNRMNVHYAIQHLARKGIVEGRRKAGTIVSRTITPALARELKNEATKRICVIRSRNNFEHLSWNKDFETGLNAPLKAEGYHLETLPMDGINSREDLKVEFRRICEGGMAALLLSVRDEQDRFIIDNGDLLFQYNLHIFVYQSGAEEWFRWPFNTLTVNHFGEGRLAGEFLVEEGFQKIAFCDISNDRQSSPLRWLAERFKGLQFGVARMSDGTSEPEQWFNVEKIYQNFMDGGKTHALVAGNDFYAAKIIDHFKGKGLTPGRDFKIIGFDDNPDFSKLQMTTICLPHREMGRIFGEMVVRHSAISSGHNVTEYLKVDPILKDARPPDISKENAK